VRQAHSFPAGVFPCRTVSADDVTSSKSQVESTIRLDGVNSSIMMTPLHFFDRPCEFRRCPIRQNNDVTGRAGVPHALFADESSVRSSDRRRLLRDLPQPDFLVLELRVLRLDLEVADVPVQVQGIIALPVALLRERRRPAQTD
jgi:hypothetical protein